MKFEELFGRLPKKVVSDMKNCEQDKVKHPEGSAYVHTEFVFQNVLSLYGDDEFLPELLVAALFHDLGKPETAVRTVKDGVEKISNLTHEYKSLNFVDKYFDLYSDLTTNREMVVEVVKNHMRAHLYANKVMKKPTKRKAFEDLKYFKQLMQFTVCDTTKLLTL